MWPYGDLGLRNAMTGVESHLLPDVIVEPGDGMPVGQERVKGEWRVRAE